MTIDEKLTRLEQEIDSLNSVVDLALEEGTGADAQALKLQIAARFESCEGILKSVRRDIADKDRDDPLRRTVLGLRDQLSLLLDRYEGQPGAGQSKAATS